MIIQREQASRDDGREHQSRNPPGGGEGQGHPASFAGMRTLECPASEPPDLPIQVQLDRQASFAAKLIKEGFGPSWRSHQFDDY
jgi:hypothetical protein